MKSSLFSVATLQAFAILFLPRVSAQSDGYATHELSYGIRVDVPAHWTVIEKDMRKNLNMNGEAIATSAGAASGKGVKETLIAVNATPAPTAAMLRISVTKPSPMSQDDLRSIGKPECAAVGQLIEEQLKEGEAHGGMKLVKMQTVTTEVWNQKRALVIPIVRKGADGVAEWQVTMYRIPTNYGLVEIQLSNRISDAVIWKPILGKIKESIRF